MAGELVAKYITGVERALQQLRDARLDGKAAEVLDLARRYYEDAKHYVERGEHLTGLVCIVYSEGLLDALRILGFVEFSWER
ncbi:MAG: DUF357 domain-containing protein [Candidatus Verstraetearchaeota archaeon]|nr:DUF357 domain-containing protein [Candidatus Verstraetearchaeota archaeon]